MIRPIIIHIHIPKTAGSTLNFAISDALGQHRQVLCALIEHAEKLAAEHQDERNKIDFIFGHYPYGLHKLFTRSVLYTASLREPRDRILSMYRFILSNDDHPLHHAVKQNSNDFSSFLRLASEEQKIQDAVDNVQARMLSGDMGLRRDADYSDRVRLALANIMGPDFLVGDMQRLDGLSTRLGQTLLLHFGPLPRLNVSKADRTFDKEVHRLDPDARGLLERFSKWDTLVYAELSTVEVAIAGSKVAIPNCRVG